MLFHVRAYLAAIIVFILPVTATARDAADAALKWGLIGTWAVDCAQKPSRSNNHLTYQRGSGGRLIHKRDFGDIDDENEVVEAKILPAGTLEMIFDFKSLSPPQKRRTVFEKVSADSYRALENQKVGTSDFSVKDGKLVSTGAPMTLNHRCR